MIPVLNAIDRIDQLGFVVDDMEAAILHWTRTCGIGPFFLHEHVPYAEFTYRGAATPVDLTLAFSFLGPLQIELILQHGDAPSVYTNLKRSAPNGLVHMAQYTDDLEASARGLIANGAEIIQYSRDVDGVETIYLDTDHHNGGLIEFIKVQDMHKARGEEMRAAIAEWDGSRPIRPLHGPLT